MKFATSIKFRASRGLGVLILAAFPALALASSPSTNSVLPPQEEYPLQTNQPIKFESELCSQNRSGYHGVWVWKVRISDGNLNNVLTRWARVAGWQVKWDAKYDAPIEYNWSIRASFDCALNEILRNSQGTQLPLMGQMYLGNKVLLITDAK